MSSTIQARCENCGENGPRIHRTAGGAVEFWPKVGEDVFDENLAIEEWRLFIIEHEYCDFIMASQASDEKERIYNDGN